MDIVQYCRKCGKLLVHVYDKKHSYDRDNGEPIRKIKWQCPQGLKNIEDNKAAPWYKRVPSYRVDKHDWRTIFTQGEEILQDTTYPNYKLY